MNVVNLQMQTGRPNTRGAAAQFNQSRQATPDRRPAEMRRPWSGVPALYRRPHTWMHQVANGGTCR
jgi:hypothetical protein